MVGDHGVVVWLDVPGWMGAFTSRACSLPTAANPEAANIELRTTAKPKLVIGFIADLLLFKLFKRKVMANGHAGLRGCGVVSLRRERALPRR
jgi:hypothetical protein